MADDCTHANPAHLDTNVYESRAEITTITTCLDCGGIAKSEHAVKLRPSLPGEGGRPYGRGGRRK